MHPTADLVIEGRVATLRADHGFGWADALAVRDGRVLAVGSLRVVAQVLGPTTRRWRLDPRHVVIPGITDAHLHLGMAARAATTLDLGGLGGRGPILDRIAAAHADARVDAWIEGHGWSLDAYGAWPTADDLASVAPGRRISLWSHDHHARWVSRPVLDALERRQALPLDQPLVRRDDTGRPTGILHEAAAALVEPLLPPWDRDRRIEALAGYAATLATLGVTGVHDPGDLDDEADPDAGPGAYRDLAAAHGLPLRVVASLRERQLDGAIARGWRTGEGAAIGDGRFRVGWLKLFTDGSLGSRSAALLAPYEVADPAGAAVGGPAGLVTMSATRLGDLARRATAAGIALQVHAIGDASVRMTLGVLEQLPRLAVAHRIEHAQLIDPADVARFGRSGIAASVQPCHLGTDLLAMRDAWGERTAHAFPLADLDRTGALLPLGTDAPVERPDPWRNLALAVTRTDPAWPLSRDAGTPGQALGVARALRAACLDPAATAGREDLGRLVAGSVADLSIVPAAGLVDPGDRGRELAATRPLATLIDGRVVFRHHDFDP